MTKVVTLFVYAYSSFTSSFGVGPHIIKNFENKCSCKVVLVNAGDAGSLINRIKIEGKKTKADVVLGVDGAFKYKLQKDLGWQVTPEPFNKSPLAFVYNAEETKNAPTDLDDLLKPDWKNQIIIPDPRLSTAGLGFLLWVIQEKGERGAWDYLKKLKQNIKMISPSWDLAYGMFKKNQTKLVLSYWTSPAYHIQEEGKENIKAAAFNRGQYEQVEYMAINPHTKHKQLAQQFIEEMQSDESQKLLMEKNYMYSYKNNFPLTPAFKKLGNPKVIIKSIEDEKIKNNLDMWLKRWREIFS